MRREVCIKTRSTPASLPLKGQVTEQTTVEWSIRKASTDPVHGYSEPVSIDTDVASNTSEQVDDPSSANSGGEDHVEQPEGKEVILIRVLSILKRVCLTNCADIVRRNFKSSSKFKSLISK